MSKKQRSYRRVYRNKRRKHKDETNKSKTTFIQELKEWTKTIFVALIIFLIINIFIVM